METGAIDLQHTEHRIDRGFLYGLTAEFDDPHRFLEACEKTREAGYKRIDGYTPFPVHGLDEALGNDKDYLVGFIMLAGGIMGGLGGFLFLAWATVVAYPLNIGGRPLFSWPSWIPITFELTVLLSALSGIVGMFMLNGLPQPYHPVFEAPNFDRATSDRFFLAVEATDPQFDRDGTREFLESLGALNVAEVELRK